MRVLIISFVFILLIIGCTIPKELSQPEEEIFSYTIGSPSVQTQEEFDNLTKEERRRIKVEGNTVSIRRFFPTPNPCTGQSYNITKNGSIINIIPYIQPSKSDGAGCVMMLGIDWKEINITLSKGEYTIKFHRCDELPFDCTKNITIE